MLAAALWALVQALAYTGLVLAVGTTCCPKPKNKKPKTTIPGQSGRPAEMTKRRRRGADAKVDPSQQFEACGSINDDDMRIPTLQTTSQGSQGTQDGQKTHNKKSRAQKKTTEKKKQSCVTAADSPTKARVKDKEKKGTVAEPKKEAKKEEKKPATKDVKEHKKEEKREEKKDTKEEKVSKKEEKISKKEEKTSKKEEKISKKEATSDKKEGKKPATPCTARRASPTNESGKDTQADTKKPEDSKKGKGKSDSESASKSADAATQHTT